MKRNGEPLGNAYKRSYTIDTVDTTVEVTYDSRCGGVGCFQKILYEQDSDQGNYFHLSCQNKSLSLEVLNQKRALTEARKELEMMRRKSREMEALVSLIQRAWSQLDIDSSMLLDSLGDSDFRTSTDGSSELLYHLLHAGQQHNHSEPINLETIPTLDTDQWSTKEEIECERQKAELTIKNNLSIPRLIQEDTADINLCGAVSNTLTAHTTFTLSLLERLCNAINESNAIPFTEDMIKKFIQLKENHSEKLMIHDRMIKLTSEISTLQSKLKISENEKIRLHHKLDKALLVLQQLIDSKQGNIVENLKELDLNYLLYQANLPSSSSSSSSVPSVIPNLNPNPMIGQEIMMKHSVDGGITNHDDGEAMNHHENNTNYEKSLQHAKIVHQSIENELHRQISVLKQQLNESELEKSKVEMNLTERLARPMSQIETQVGDMRHAMEELRQQCKQRVSSLLAEIAVGNEKISNLELAIAQVEAIACQRIEEVISISEKEIVKVREEKSKYEKMVRNTEIDGIHREQLKKQVDEYQEHDALSQKEVMGLRNKLEQLEKTQKILLSNLESSREQNDVLQQQMMNEMSPAVGMVKKENSVGDHHHHHHQVVNKSKHIDDDMNHHRSNPSAVLHTTLSSPPPPPPRMPLILQLVQPIVSPIVPPTPPPQGMLPPLPVPPPPPPPVPPQFPPPRVPIKLISPLSPPPTPSSSSSSSSSAAAVTVIVPTVSSSSHELIIDHLKKQIVDLTSELQDARGNINDLFLEIEGISSDEMKTRNQNSKLLFQINDCQTMQRMTLAENLKLLATVEEMNASKIETDIKLESIRSIMHQQESMMNQLRVEENALRVEYQLLRKTSLEEQAKRHEVEQQLLENQHKLVDAESSLESMKKRVQELQTRSDELVKQCESERKLRFEIQRELKSKNALLKKEKSLTNGTNAAALSEKVEPNVDKDMLDMTLGMLRCSICKDRFKSVAIMRCFHLFCKECIDENVKNRNRKCPACGEKFGQDDVRNVYFTH